eukprot:GHVH01001823.1.p1 GENE.GHVH01001823.1~~GHVH01001823.1.p1  ORF type:complete len:459 (-),score=58.81 GHVH01001823.1:20-1396(-)
MILTLPQEARIRYLCINQPMNLFIGSDSRCLLTYSATHGELPTDCLLPRVERLKCISMVDREILLAILAVFVTGPRTADNCSVPCIDTLELESISTWSTEDENGPELWKLDLSRSDIKHLRLTSADLIIIIPLRLIKLTLGQSEVFGLRCAEVELPICEDEGVIQLSDLTIESLTDRPLSTSFADYVRRRVKRLETTNFDIFKCEPTECSKKRLRQRPSPPELTPSSIDSARCGHRSVCLDLPIEGELSEMPSPAGDRFEFELFESLEELTIRGTPQSHGSVLLTGYSKTLTSLRIIEGGHGRLTLDITKCTRLRSVQLHRNDSPVFTPHKDDIIILSNSGSRLELEIEEDFVPILLCTDDRPERGTINIRLCSSSPFRRQCHGQICNLPGCAGSNEFWESTGMKLKQMFKVREAAFNGTTLFRSLEDSVFFCQCMLNYAADRCRSEPRCSTMLDGSQ